MLSQSQISWNIITCVVYNQYVQHYNNYDVTSKFKVKSEKVIKVHKYLNNKECTKTEMLMWYNVQENTI